MNSREVSKSDDDIGAKPDARLYESTRNTIDSEILIRKTFESDQKKGFELLFKRYYQPLCSHAVRYVYSRATVEDIVMEVFSKFWQKKIFADVNTSYRAYLFTTVRHACFAYLKTEFGREQSFGPAPSSDTEMETTSTPQQILLYDELHNKIQEVLSAIPPQSQRVFILSRFEGKKNQDIAEELSISMKTVEGHITKALSIMRRSLLDNGFISVLFMCFIQGSGLSGFGLFF